MNNQNEVDADCKMFCQTMKCECNILFYVWIYGLVMVSFLTNL